MSSTRLHGQRKDRFPSPHQSEPSPLREAISPRAGSAIRRAGDGRGVEALLEAVRALRSLRASWFGSCGRWRRARRTRSASARLATRGACGDARSAKGLRNLVQKAQAGADFLITQLFFDNRCYFDFRRPGQGRRRRTADHSGRDDQLHGGGGTQPTRPLARPQPPSSSVARCHAWRRCLPESAGSSPSRRVGRWLFHPLSFRKCLEHFARQLPSRQRVLPG
jgi:hypothetical protein